MTRFSTFGERFTRPTGALELMADLGSAATAAGPVFMLGGGNPARIPEVEALFRRRLAEIAADADQFGRFAGSYSGPEGDLRFRGAVAELLAREFGWPLDERNVALTPGSQTAFFALFNLLAGPRADGSRGRVLLPLAPEYIGYADLGLTEGLLVSHRASIEELPDGLFKYHVDFDGLEVPDDVAAICVSRPTNPSGNVLGRAELERLDALARGRRVPLIVDAAYGMPFPGIQFGDTDAHWNDNVILCLSLSKIGLPATRTGIVVAERGLAEAVAAVCATTALAPPGTGAVIVEPLLRSGELLETCRRVIRPFYEQRRNQALGWLREELRDLPCRVQRPDGAFFLWLWFPGLPVTAAELYRRLKARGVLVIAGHHFFPGLDGAWRHRDECIRINYCQPPEHVRAGVRIIAEELRRAFDAG